MATDSDHAAPDPPKDERSHFLAHMGHDLRAPMTNILALTEALVDGVYGPMAQPHTEILKHIRDNGHRMINMITDLVDLARIETGQLRLENVACDIMDACRNGLDMARGLAKSKKVTIESEFVPPSVSAMGDARRLRQLVAGLANASVVAAPAEGRVRFQLEIPSGEAKLRIRIVTAKRGDQSFPTETSCSDPAILSRWRKLSSVAVTTVEKIVELHEGTLEVCDSPGGLFSVSVTLPLVLADADGKPVDGATRGTKPGGESKAPLILLADDEDIIRTITRDYLESTGYRVLAVTNGREALDLIHAEAPDLVIMDMQMPVLDGMEALQQLRRSSDPKIASTPVISLSGLATPGHREKCLAAGATSCLAKPFGIKDLDRAIQEAINKKA